MPRWSAAVEERMAFVARVCDADAALRAEVERLLAAHAQAGELHRAIARGGPVAHL